MGESWNGFADDQDTLPVSSKLLAGNEWSTLGPALLQSSVAQAHCHIGAHDPRWPQYRESSDPAWWLRDEDGVRGEGLSKMMKEPSFASSIPTHTFRQSRIPHEPT